MISCIQQLIIVTPEYQSSNTAEQSGQARVIDAPTSSNSTKPYKALVYLFLDGAMDSYNMLTPMTCSPIDVYDKYRVARGKSDTNAGVGLPLNRLLELDASTSIGQPCSSFGVHEDLLILKQLYDAKELNFVAGAGLMSQPVNISNYKDINVQLFAHNSMQDETKRDDLADVYAGTGVGGRIAEVMAAKTIPIPTNTFSIKGQTVFLNQAGQEGTTPPFNLDSNGLDALNEDPSITNMNDVIRSLNGETVAESTGFFAETWSEMLIESMDQQDSLKTELDSTTVNTLFPDTSIGQQLKLATQIMQTAPSRGIKRDIIYVEDTGYDNHNNVDTQLSSNFIDLDAALSAFVTEVKALNLWSSVTLVQFTEFARTLDPNSGGGTDHAW